MLAVRTLVLPNYTKTLPGPLDASAQLIFVAASLALYSFFLHAQRVWDRDDFHDPADDRSVHAPVLRRAFLAKLALLATVSLAMGRTTSLQGDIHLVIFGAFLTLSAKA